MFVVRYATGLEDHVVVAPATFWTQHVNTMLSRVHILSTFLGSDSIGYVTEAYRICCMVLSIYFFSIGVESD